MPTPPSYRWPDASLICRPVTPRARACTCGPNSRSGDGVTGMAWTHRFKPPSGIPAMGPGWGPGWGGPAKGAGSPARPFTVDSPTRNTGYGDRSPKRIAERKRLIAEQEERKEQMIEMLEGLALNPKTNMSGAHHRRGQGAGPACR